MKKIGIISDTHSYWDEKYLHYFEPCDEIWHAGDIGSLEVAATSVRWRWLRNWPSFVRYGLSVAIATVETCG